jgi:hypothetical protein
MTPRGSDAAYDRYSEVSMAALWMRIAALCLLILAPAARLSAQPRMPDVLPEAPATVPAAAPAEAIPAPPAAPVAPLAPVAPASATTEPATVPAVLPAPALQMTLAACDHPSGIYYAREPVRCTLLIENPHDQPMTLRGRVEFGSMESSPFKPLAITPLTDTPIAPHQRARIEVTADIGAPGRYQLRWDGQPISSPSGLQILCIYPPRPAPEAGPGDTLKPVPSRFVMRLPRAAALVPGFLADFAARTHVRRFVLEDSWPLPRRGGIIRFGGPLDLSAADVETLLAEVRAAKVTLILRIQIAADMKDDSATLAALNAHIAAMVKAGRAKSGPKSGPGVFEALVLDYSSTVAEPPEAKSARAAYLAVYDAAKKLDKNIVLLGLGTVARTQQGLLNSPQGQSDLAPYVDGVATSPLETVLDISLGIRPLGSALPSRRCWVLPMNLSDLSHRSGEGTSRVIARDVFGPLTDGDPAFTLAQTDATAGLAAVPVPDFDRGVSVHLLEQAVFYQRLRPQVPPFVAVFQGNGYSLAAIAGPGAGSPTDADWFTALPPTGGTLEVSDDTGDLRVIDAFGDPVDCRAGDVLKIPLDTHIRYLLATVTADDLLATLRSSTVQGLPRIGIGQRGLTPAKPAEGTSATIDLDVRNAMAEEYSGEIEVLLPSHPDATGKQQNLTLGRAVVAKLASGDHVVVHIPYDPAAVGASDILTLRAHIGPDHEDTPWPMK